MRSIVLFSILFIFSNFAQAQEKSKFAVSNHQILFLNDPFRGLALKYPTGGFKALKVPGIRKQQLKKEVIASSQDYLEALFSSNNAVTILPFVTLERESRLNLSFKKAAQSKVADYYLSFLLNLSDGNQFSVRMADTINPQVSIKLTIADRTGKKVWSKSHKVTDQPYVAEDLGFSGPAILEEDGINAVAELYKKLVKETYSELISKIDFMPLHKEAFNLGVEKKKQVIAKTSPPNIQNDETSHAKDESMGTGFNLATGNSTLIIPNSPLKDLQTFDLKGDVAHIVQWYYTYEGPTNSSIYTKPTYVVFNKEKRIQEVAFQNNRLLFEYNNAGKPAFLVQGSRDFSNSYSSLKSVTEFKYNDKGNVSLSNQFNFDRTGKITESKRALDEQPFFFIDLFQGGPNFESFIYPVEYQNLKEGKDLELLLVYDGKGNWRKKMWVKNHPDGSRTPLFAIRRDIAYHSEIKDLSFLESYKQKWQADELFLRYEFTSEDGKLERNLHAEVINAKNKTTMDKNGMKALALKLRKAFNGQEMADTKYQDRRILAFDNIYVADRTNELIKHDGWTKEKIYAISNRLLSSENYFTSSISYGLRESGQLKFPYFIKETPPNIPKTIDQALHVRMAGEMAIPTTNEIKYTDYGMTFANRNKHFIFNDKGQLTGKFWILASGLSAYQEYIYEKDSLVYIKEYSRLRNMDDWSMKGTYYAFGQHKQSIHYADGAIDQISPNEVLYDLENEDGLPTRLTHYRLTPDGKITPKSTYYRHYHTQKMANELLNPKQRKVLIQTYGDSDFEVRECMMRYDTAYFKTLDLHIVPKNNLKIATDANLADAQKSVIANCLKALPNKSNYRHIKISFSTGRGQQKYTLPNGETLAIHKPSTYNGCTRVLLKMEEMLGL